MNDVEYLRVVSETMGAKVDPRVLGEYTLRLVECKPLVPAYRVQVSMTLMNKFPIVFDTAKSKSPEASGDALAGWLNNRLPVMS